MRRAFYERFQSDIPINEELIDWTCLALYIYPLIFGFSNKVSGIGVRMFNA